MRISGFYFVKVAGEWTIGKFTANEQYPHFSTWDVLGFFYEDVGDSDLDEIGDRVDFPRKYGLQSHPEMKWIHDPEEDIWTLRSGITVLAQVKHPWAPQAFENPQPSWTWIPSSWTWISYRKPMREGWTTDLEEAKRQCEKQSPF